MLNKWRLISVKEFHNEIRCVYADNLCWYDIMVYLGDYLGTKWCKEYVVYGGRILVLSIIRFYLQNYNGLQMNMINYRVISDMTVTGEKFRAEYINMGGPVTRRKDHIHCYW